MADQPGGFVTVHDDADLTHEGSGLALAVYEALRPSIVDPFDALPGDADSKRATKLKLLQYTAQYWTAVASALLTGGAGGQRVKYFPDRLATGSKDAAGNPIYVTVTTWGVSLDTDLLIARADLTTDKTVSVWVGDTPADVVGARLRIVNDSTFNLVVVNLRADKTATDAITTVPAGGRAELAVWAVSDGAEPRWNLL
jgi:hypothetical protein